MARTKAFPEAEGFGAGTLGAMATGAGAASVMRVTNLNNSGSGSLRAALEASGARFVVFDIGGTISLSAPIEISNPYCTVLGQTAPADSGGITIKNGGTLTSPPLKVAASEVILRYIRVRCGDSVGYDGTTLQGLGIGKSGVTVTNVILDHCSISWSADQDLTLWHNTRDITVQWCIVGESLYLPESNPKEGVSGKAWHFGSGNDKAAGNISAHHNLLATSTDRMPNIVTDVDYPVEWINNVSYDGVWSFFKMRDSYGAEPQVDIVKNYFKSGPNTKPDRWEIVTGFVSARAGAMYVEGNIAFDATGTNLAALHRTDDEMAESVCVYPGSRQYMVSSRLASPTVTITETNANQAFADVVESSGCRIPSLDTVDQRMISNTLTGSGELVRTPIWPALAAGTPWVRTAHGDEGLPDYYIDANPGVAWGDIDASTEMTQLEVWAGSLVGSVGSAGDGGTSGGGEETGDGDTGFTPDGYVDYPITRSEDNAYTYQDDFFNDEVFSIHAGHFSATQYNEWMLFLFRNVQVAQGDTLSQASIRLFVPRVDGVAPSLVIIGADEDDAYDLSSIDDTSRFNTSATVAWTPSADTTMETVESPNISSIITEIVGRAGWEPGGNIALAIKPVSVSWPGSEQVFHARAYDSDNPSPTLRIAITDVAGGGGVETQNLQVAASGDDAYGRQGSTSANLTASELYTGEYNATFYYYRTMALVDVAVTVPAAATVKSATLSLYLTAIGGAGPFNIRISAEDTDAAPAPTSLADIDAAIAAETTSTVLWQPAVSELSLNDWNDIDVTDIIQELHASHGLDSGDTIGMLIYAANSTFVENRRLQLESYDGDPTKAIKLSITHTTPSDYIKKRTVGQPLRGGLHSGLAV